MHVVNIQRQESRDQKDSRRKFLSAQWRNLAIVNFAVPSSLLKPYIPAGTELDHFEGETLASVIGFAFQHTKFFGLRVPWHSNFSEVNLRFYVRRIVHDDLRRGVVFIKEIVARRAVALTARWFYGENYVRMPMRQRMVRQSDANGTRIESEYQWHSRADSGATWNQLGVVTRDEPKPFTPGSLEEFIVEHYWGYSRLSGNASFEYAVDHPPWRVAPADAVLWDCDVQATYGSKWVPYLSTPHSALFADGSKVSVYRGQRVLDR